ncbi:hypothetical protein EV44_g2218 [Erysiphe necator]|uniref:Uncharacterized protein n=1 Tax=Uncinula necator TaxID=52586 RepID=A0A0B1P7H8_UNCNE|nr:hypothetical protein EV44_g2218 [Erysiphe necator]
MVYKERTIAGVRCNSMFYKQSRVEAVAEKACRDLYARQGLLLETNPLAKYFRSTLKDFPGPASLFPKAAGFKLTMVPITKSFFSPSRIKTFLGIRKKDYIVFANMCTVVGIVREQSKKNFILCEAVNGGSIADSPIEPGIM